MSLRVLSLAYVAMLPSLHAQTVPVCWGMPDSAPNVQRNCDTHRSAGAQCRYSCPDGHSLMGPFAVGCVCAADGSACAWNSPPGFTIQCISWATSWPTVDTQTAKSQTMSTGSSTFSVVNDGLAALRALVGDDDINSDDEVEREVELELDVRSADNTCDGLTAPGNGGAWLCTDSNIDGSVCDLGCPEGFVASDESAETQTCTCETEEDGPIIIQLGCSWTTSTAPTCVEDEEYRDSCIALSPPENASMECTDGFYEGTLCKFTCTNDPDVMMPDKTGRRRCKCREDRGCFWTRSEGTCQAFPISPECDAAPTVFENTYTDLICDDTNNHGSTCEYTCAADFRLNQRGRRSRCRCLRRRGVYNCTWTRDYDDKWCVPAPRWYRKWNRAYAKAERRGDEALMQELTDEYAEVNAWADEELSFAGSMGRRLRRRRSSGWLELLSNGW